VIDLFAGQRSHQQTFSAGLNRPGIDWFPSMEINSLDTIETCVADGFGLGLSVSIPKTKLSPKVRSLATGRLCAGCLWRLGARKTVSSIANVTGRIAGRGTVFAQLEGP
jgi:hypothetical protein